MSLTEREKQILKLAMQGLSDYKIARKLDVDPPTVARSRKNALKKLQHAQEDLNYARSVGWLTATPKASS
jgi:DNA-binding NarL/FixJ family response regulator